MPWRPSPPGFAARLGLATSGLIALVCIVQSALLGRSALDQLGRHLRERGTSIAAYLAAEARGPLAGGDLEALRQLAAQAGAESGVLYTRFFDPQGLLLVAAGGAGAGELWEFEATSARTDVPASAERLGRVAVGLSIESLAGLRRRMLATAVVLTALCAAAAVLAAVLLARAFTRPLRALATAADAIARGEVAPPVEVRTRDEIGRLARSFTAMTVSLARSRAALEQQVEELQRASRLKSEFVATMSHELRTPLNVILGYAEMLQDGGGGPLAPAQAELVDGIRRYALAQRDLVTGILDFSRLSAGRAPVRVEEVALAPLLADIQAACTPRVEDGRVRVMVAVHADVPAVATDAGKLSDALRHLVDNALKFTAAGTVTLAARPGLGADRVLIEVSDTGCGIPEEELPHIFDAFLQLGTHRTRHTGGVGLGLAIVHSLVDALGGTITVTSRVGAGTSFRIDLPRRLEPAPLPAAEAALDETARNAEGAGRDFVSGRQRTARSRRPAHA